MIIGYARVSTTEQLAGYEAQLVSLNNEGCERIFKEQVSAVKFRAELEAAITYVREGDIFVVTKLCRLARSTQHLLEVVERLKAKGVGLKILNLGLNTNTPTGMLMLTLLGAISEFERSLMLERQRDGVQAAKLAGKYHGRQPTARAKTDQILQLLATGKTRKEVAEIVGVGVASVYRVIAGSRLAA